ncbi:MAG: hypothetical protein EA398_08275 [Deltaproteobacteria bacterium]|nr:MAG: hypothetical protein EA398_08275 [Deltaproteobacteria bacterium]
MSSAISSLIEALREEPDNPSALIELEQLWIEAGETDELTSRMPGLADGLSDPVMRARFKLRAASLLAMQRSVEDAAEVLWQAADGLLIDDVVAALKAGFSGAGDWAGLHRACLSLAEVAMLVEEGKPLAARLVYLAGDVCENRLHDPDEANRLYSRAFKLDMFFREPLHAARRLFRGQENWARVVKLYDIELRLEQEPGARARLLRELGELYIDSLGDADAGATMLLECLELDPGQTSVRERLVAMGLAESADEEAEVGESQSEDDAAAAADEGLESDESGAGDAESSAELEGAAAVGEEAEEALSLEPAEAEPAPVDEEEPSVPESEIAAEGESSPEAAEPAEANADEPMADVDGVAEMADAEDSAAEDVEETAAAEELAASDEPAEEPAVSEAPELSTERRACSASARAESAVQALAEVAQEHGGDERAWWLGELLDALRATGASEAELVDRIVEAIEEAESPLRTVCALLPATLGEDAVWQAVALRLEESPVLEGEEQASALYAVRFYALRDADGAEGLAPRAGADAQLEVAALETARKGNWRKTMGTLTDGLQERGLSKDAAEQESYVFQAFMALGLDNEDKAADSLRRLLRKDKSNALARMLSRRLNTRGEKWSAVADVLKTEVEELGDALPAYRAWRLEQLLRIYREELNQDMMVVNTYQSLLDAEPHNLELIDELSELLEKLNRYPEMVDLLRRKAEATPGEEERVAVLQELAGLLTDRFNNPTEAIRTLEQILEIDPVNVEALTQLEDMYEKRREFEKLIDAKKRLVELDTDPEAQAERLRSCAEVAQMRMRDNDLAVSLWREVLDVRPGDDAALGALEQLYERDKDWESLAGVLSARVDTLSDAAALSQALTKLGQIQGDRLDRTEEAMETWERLLDLEPENMRARESLKKSYLDLEMWDRLEGFYERLDQWAEYVRQIETVANRHEDDATRLDLLFRAADTWIERLEKPERATKSLETILGMDPSNRRAASLLAPFYEERRDFRKLPEILEVILDGAEESAERFSLQRQLAEIHREHLRAPDVALRWYAAALSEQADARGLVEPMQECAEASGDWTTLEQALSDARGVLYGDPDRAGVWREYSFVLGRLFEERLEDDASALPIYDEVLGQLPEDPDALQAKDRIFTRMEAWDELLEVLEAQVLLRTDAEDAIPVLERICRIHEEQREDALAAIDVHGRILEIAPEHWDSLRALDRLHAETGDAAAREEILGRLLLAPGVADDPHAEARVRVERARLRVEPLAEYAAAVEDAEAVARLAPDHPELIALLSELVEVEETRLSAARMLEPLHEKAGDWPAYVEVLEIQLESETDAARRVDLLSRVGEVQQGRLRDEQAATDAWSRLLQTDPHSDLAVSQLEQLAPRLDGWEHVTALYEETVDTMDLGSDQGQARAVSLLERASRFRDGALGDLDEAIRLQRRVLDVVPGREATLLALDDLLRRAERWEELLANYEERLLAAETAEDRRALRFEAAGVCEQWLEDPVQAIDKFREVVSEAPDDTEALEQLDRLYGVIGDAPARAENLEALLALREPGSEDANTLKNRLAELLEQDLGEVERAIGLWSDVLATDPENLGARSALERQVEDEAWAAQASAVLEPLYREAGDWGRLVHLLDVQLQHLDDEDARRSMFGRIATLQEEDIGDLSAAWQTALRALAERLDDDANLERTFRLAPQLEAWPQLADALEQLADEALDPEVGRRVLMRVAEVREVQLGNRDAAMDIWRRLLDADPMDLKALRALERLCGEAALHGELVDVLLRLAEHPEVVGVPAERAELQYRAADLHERALEAPEEAVDVLQAILRDDPAQRRAIEQLERLFSGLERWDELVETLEQKIAIASDDAERIQLHYRLGQVLQEQADDPDRAIMAYRAVLAVDGTQLAALEALDNLYAQTENWPEQLEVLRERAALADVSADRMAIQFRMGRIHEQELMDARSALDIYSTVLGEMPAHEPTRQALLGLIERGEEAATAGALLEPLYRAEERWEELLFILSRRIEAADAPEERRDLWVECATIHEQRLGDANRALEATGQAARESLRQEEVDCLERLGAATERWPDVVELFMELHEEALEPSLRSDIGLRVARLRETTLADVEGAIEMYTRVHEEDAGDTTSLVQLDRLYAMTGQADALAETLQKRLLVEADAAEATGLRLRLAEVYAQSLGESAEAVNVYREVLAAEDTNEAAIGALEGLVGQGVETYEIATILEPIYRAHARWDALIRLNEARIAVEDSPDERFRLWVENADLFATQVPDPERLLGALGNALIERPGDGALKERIEEIAGGEPEQWTAVWGIYHAALELEDLADEERFDIALRLAEVLNRKLGDVANAEAFYLHALEVEPGEERALAPLDELYSAQERWAELSDVLARRRESVFDQEVLVRLTARHAELHETRLQDPDAAIATWNEVGDLDPNHVGALDALERLYGQTANWEALFDVHERRTMLLETEEERLPTLEAMARLAAERLERPLDSIDFWVRVVTAQPEHGDALQWLAALYEQTEQFNELVDVLDRQVQRTEDPALRLDLLKRLGWYQAERLENDDAAVDAYRRIREIEPADPDALVALRVLFERMGDAENLSATLEDLLKHGLVPEEEQLAVHEELGRLYTEQLMRPEDAVRAWNHVRELAPGHEEALERLDETFLQEQRWQELVEVIEARVAAIAEVEERSEECVDLLKRIAGLWQGNLDSKEHAAGAWERVLDYDLTDFDALHQLETLWPELGAWESYAALCIDRLEVIEDDMERLETLRKAARIYEEHLEQPEASFLLLERALREAPHEQTSYEEIERIAGITAKWDELVVLYQALTQQLVDESGEAETLPLQLAIGRVQEEKLDRPEMAEIFYEKALFIEPENEQALRSLRRIYARTENWDSMVDALKRLADISYDAEEQVALYMEAGDLLENRLGNLEGAVDAWKLALGIDEQHAPALLALERAYEALGRWNELIETLEQRAMSTFEPSELVPIRFRIAETWRDRLEDDDRAVDAFNDLLSVDPQNEPAMVALEELYARLEDWQRYVDVLDDRANLAADNAEVRREVLFKQAWAFETQFDDIDRAVGCLRDVLALDAKDLQAIGELERVFADQERLDELVDTYEMHVQAADEPGAKIEVLGVMGHTLAVNMDDPFRGIETYRRILELDERNAVALQSLGTLYEGNEDWQNAIDSYQRLAEVTAEDTARLDLMQRAAEIQEVELGDLDGAEKRYLSALESAPEYVPAMQALQRVYMTREQWQPAIDMIQRQVEHTRDLTERANLFVQIGMIYESHLDDLAQGQQFLEEAIQLDPKNVWAATPLAEIYMAAERWEKARPLVKLLLEDDQVEKDDDQRMHLHYSLGRTSEELGDRAEAIAQYEEVLRYDSAHLEALFGLARLYTDSGQDEDAYRIYLDLLSAHRDTMSTEQLVEAYYTAGTIKARIEDQVAAQDMFERALQVVPTHEKSLRALIDIRNELGDHNSVIALKKQLLEVAPDDLERYTLLVDIGDAHVEAGNHDEAVVSYRAAVKIDPESKVVLHKLLNVFTTTEQWKRATEVLGLLTNVEGNETRRAKLLFTIGTIFRDYLDDRDQAVTFFNSALDANLLELPAFQAIDELLTAERDWKALERGYRKMIERVRSTDDPAQHKALEFQLYKGLGEIYRSRLGDLRNAINAFRLAASVMPEDELVHQILAELYERTGESGPEVIAEHQRLIKISPFRIESYRALFNAFISQKQFDRAWCMAAALRLLGKATPDEAKYYEKYLPKSELRPRRSLTSDHWKALLHEDVNPYLSGIFRIIIENLREELAVRHKDLGIHHRKDALALTEKTPLTRAIEDNLRVQGVAPPRIYVRTSGSGLYPVRLPEPSLLAGQNVVGGLPPLQLAFEVARAVALLRPELALGSLFQTSELKVFLYATFTLFGIPAPNDAPADLVADYARTLAGLPAPVQNQLQRYVQGLLASGQAPNLSAWLKGVDYTASRVGMLMCGDLRQAVASVRDSATQIGKADVKERVRDLTLFGISEEYFQLREDLGLGLSNG